MEKNGKITAVLLAVTVMLSVLSFSYSACAAEGASEININCKLLDSVMQDRPWVIDTLLEDDWSGNPYASVLAVSKGPKECVMENYTESLAFRAVINAMELYANKFSDMPFPSLKIDCKLNPSKLAIDLIEQVEEFEPFGVGNSKPVFALCNMTLKKITPVGGGKHLRLTLSRDGNTLTAMRFSVTKDQFPYNVGDILDLAVNVDINEYYNEKSISVIIIDCKLSNSDTEIFLTQHRIFEKLKRNEQIDKSSAEKLTPSRDEFAIVYRYLRKNNGMNFGVDILYHRLDEKLEFGKILVIIDIMKELNLIEVSIDGDNYNISVNQSPNKVNLESSLLLNKIKQWRY